MSFSRTPAMWCPTKPLLILALSSVCALSFAEAMGQTAGEPARGSTPPGMSQDGAKPADGAIQGGSAAGGTSIAPGENAGRPSRTPSSTEERLKRCDELTGSLRDECLKDDPSAPREPREKKSVPGT